MRTEKMKILRINHHMTQSDVAEKIGISLSLYNLIENGKRVGSIETWEKIQKLFFLSDKEMWSLMKDEK